MRIILSLAILSAGLIFGGCATAPQSAEGKDVLAAECDAAMSTFRRQDPGIDRFFDNSAGYAVFPSIGKGGIGVGGAYGRGQLYQGKNFMGYCDMSQGSIGFQLGGQSFSEIIFFQTEEALTRFKSNSFEFAAGASAVAAESGAATTSDYSNGVAVFIMVNGGLMYEAAIGGQSFTYQAR